MTKFISYKQVLKDIYLFLKYIFFYLFEHITIFISNKLNFPESIV